MKKKHNKIPSEVVSLQRGWFHCLCRFKIKKSILNVIFYFAREALKIFGRNCRSKICSESANSIGREINWINLG